VKTSILSYVLQLVMVIALVFMAIEIHTLKTELARNTTVPNTNQSFETPAMRVVIVNRNPIAVETGDAPLQVEISR